MKATELMIGDWVKTPANPYYQVVLGDFWREDESNKTLFSLFSPIPITPEILKNNGFEIKEILHQYRWSVFYDSMLILSKVKSDYEIQLNAVPYKIQYVHELQHALRLCGLDKLADSFLMK